MDKESEGTCDTARLLEEILRACFGTIMIEPEKWRIVSAATPYRNMLRNAIKSRKAAFNERTFEALCALVNAGLRIGEDSSEYDPALVAKGITEFLKERGWGDFGGLAQQSGDARLTQERRKALAAMAKEVAIQLYGKTSISEGDEARIKEALRMIALATPQRMREEEAAEINLLATEALPASMDLLMRQIHLPDGDEFLSAADEQGSWIALSEIYCSGVKVDSIIRAALDRGIASRYGAQSEAALTYYMAKFDLKRGNVKQSDRDLWQLRRTLEGNSSKIDGACADRMSALASIRQLTNNAEPSADHAAKFESAVGALQDLNYAGDDYKAYETASAIGAEVTNALAKGSVGDGHAVTSFNRLVKQHETIVRKHPVQLGNQAVVAVSLRWFMELSRLEREPMESRSPLTLLKIAFDGLLEARRRKNSLFHVQCVAVIAICAMCGRNEELFRALCYIFAKLKRAFEVKASQEGIRQLISIMNKMAPGSSRELLADPDAQMELMKSNRSSIINWTMHLDGMYRLQMIPNKKAYKVTIEKEVIKLEAFKR